MTDYTVLAHSIHQDAFQIKQQQLAQNGNTLYESDSKYNDDGKQTAENQNQNK